MFGLILDGSCVIILSLAKNYIYLAVFSILYGIADGLVGYIYQLISGTSSKNNS